MLVVEHQADCPPSLLGDWLVEAGCTLEVVRPYDGDALPEPARHDALLVLGGSGAAADPERRPVLDLVLRAAEREVPTLGVCLGHQICALAFGGEVARSPHGQYVGLDALGLEPRGPHHGPVPAVDDAPPARRAVFWNDDVVTRLPDGAHPLAHDAHGFVQAAAFAPTVWGVQWHPEIAGGVPSSWAEEDRQRQAARGIDQARRAARGGSGPRRARDGGAGARRPVRRAGRGGGVNRAATTKGHLLRGGFEDAEAALASLGTLGDPGERLVAHLGRTADPDAALAALVRLVEAADDGDALMEAVADDEGTAMRLLSVLGASEALADHLVRHPEHWRELRDPTLGSTRPAAFAIRAALLAAVGADAADPVPVATHPDAEAVDALRIEHRRVLLRLAARDLAHDLGVDDAAAELSDLAAGVLEAALAVARQRLGDEAATVRLAVVAMGKCGGHELNYVSDVDVIFVHEPVAPEVDATAAVRASGRLAAQLMRVCSEQTGEGTIWPVDAALRPEGKAGPLSRTLVSHEGYYERWAAPWEFQALLKARPVAGDLALGRAFVATVDPMVWRVAEQEGFVAQTRAMRRRVVDHIPAREADRQLKLGEGGLRDVEFAVQLLQLVHGRGDERIRASTTLSALHALTAGGYVGRDDGEALHEAYWFLRTLEHRLQLHRLQRLHVVPDDPAALRRLGRSLGFTKEPAATLVKVWQHHRREVRRLHEKLFYRPLLEAVAQLPGAGIRMSAEAAEARLAALGYDDPVAALRHLEALTSGVTRTATIQRALLPALLGWFADGANPDAGLAGFRRLSENLGAHAVVPEHVARRGPGR